MSQEAKEKAIKKVKAKKKMNNGEIDYSVISYPLHYSPEFFGKPLDMVFRQQNFKELRHWGQIMSPKSNISPGDRTEELLKALQKCLIDPSAEEFSDWMDELFEVDIQGFIARFAEEKGNHSKK